MKKKLAFEPKYSDYPVGDYMSDYLDDYLDIDTGEPESNDQDDCE